MRALASCLRIALLLLWLPAWQAAMSADAVSANDRQMAASLSRFGSFVKWPEASATGQIVIGVLGDPRVAAELRQLLPGRRIDELPAVLREIDDVEELGDGRILFVGAAAADQLPAIVRALRGRPVLLVTDIRGGLQLGAIINFVTENRRLRFEISLPAARAAQLEPSSRLLGLAVRVEK